jgi:lipoic acid synthetase
MTHNVKKTGGAGRYPVWLKKRLPGGTRADQVTELLRNLELVTVCCGARCPNQAECFSRGTATFLILGETCTRSCRFCAIPSGSPQPPREDEPHAVAEACAQLNLRHVVITSVTRDDLPDGGAAHFARTIQAVRSRLPDARVEVLTPDFQGSIAAIDVVLDAAPDVFNHNVETVPRLYPEVRPQGDYRRSLEVLARAAARARADDGTPITKSGLMVGLGETSEEVRSVMRDLRDVSCEMLTIGQYLAPSSDHVPIDRFVEPAEFDAWAAQARDMGFSAVAAGPFVRSSYLAESLFEKGLGKGDKSTP